MKALYESIDKESSKLFTKSLNVDKLKDFQLDFGANIYPMKSPDGIPLVEQIDLKIDDFVLKLKVPCTLLAEILIGNDEERIKKKFYQLFKNRLIFQIAPYKFLDEPDFDFVSL